MVVWFAMKKNGRRVSVPALSKILFSMVLALGVCAAQAATITVTSSSDALNPGAGACTLRGAVDAINSGINDNGCTTNDDAYGTNDTIVFADTLAGETVQFTAPNGGQITISKPLTIKGPSTAATDPANRVTLQGGGDTSDFRLLNAANLFSQITVEDLNFIDGNVTTGGEYDGSSVISTPGAKVTVRRCRFVNNHGSSHGGVIGTRYGNVIVEDSEFSNNSTSIFAGAGGAIDSNGDITVRGSTFNNNAAALGGAINGGKVVVDSSTFNNNGASYNGGAISANDLVVSNSTFSNNEAGDSGGAVVGNVSADVSASTFIDNEAANGGGAIRAKTLTGRHLTLVNNTAPSGAAVSAFTSADLANSLIVSGDANAQCSGRPGVPFIGAYNLVANGAALTDDTSCGTTSNTNPVSIGAAAAITDIVETTLADHGGPTQTLALPVDSPAVGAADPNGATSQMLEVSAFPAVKWIDAETDQRGSARAAAANGRDLGASEAKVSGAKSATPIPLLGPGALALLAGLLGVIGWRRK